MEFDLLTILSPLIAIFFFWKLRSVLGTRNDSDGSGKPPSSNRDVMSDNDNVITLADKGIKTVRTKMSESDKSDDSSSDILHCVKSVDPDFDTDSFLSGAKSAYEMIVTAFASDDTKTLKNLLSKDLYGDFLSVIESRRSSGEKIVVDFVGLEKAEITDASLHGRSSKDRSAQIVIHFVSQMVRVVYDKDGKVIDGDPSQVGETTDTWTFSRRLSSNNPNWQLLATDA